MCRFVQDYKGRIILLIMRKKGMPDCFMLSGMLLVTRILRTILQRLKNEARKRLCDIRRNLLVPGLMNHHPIFMSRERKKSLFTAQRTVLRPDQLASLKTQHSTFLQPRIYQQSNTLAAQSDDLDHIQQIERVQVSRKSRLLEQAAQLLFQRMKIKR